jgi:type IV pilus assembly protein PilN
MIRINLLPYRAARKKENVRRQLNIFLGSVAIVCGLLFLLNSYFGSQIKDLNSEIASSREQVAKYKQINKEIAEIKQKLAVLDRKISVIESLDRDRKAPVRNLDSLYQLVVEKRMWYTQIEEKGTNVKVSGIAVDNQTVADYMTRLEKSERFENVRLASIKQTKEKDMNLMQFDINFQKKNPAQEPSKAKK